jgi:hypothetical protein
MGQQASTRGANQRAAKQAELHEGSGVSLDGCLPGTVLDHQGGHLV